MTDRLHHCVIPAGTGRGTTWRSRVVEGGPRLLKVPIKQVKRARRLRRAMSLPEVLLWQVLRERPDGHKFGVSFRSARSSSTSPCLARRLVIEVDGEGHNYGDRPRRDAARDAILLREGFSVMRIAALDVLKNMDGVVRGIVHRCGEVGPLHHPPSPSAAADGPPPRSRGGMMTNKLFYGDNLDVLRRKIAEESVDLCYIDPPFNSKRNYFQIYNNQGGEDRAQAQAFVDTWEVGKEGVRR